MPILPVEIHHELRKALMNAPSVLLTGPADPDGDSLGACLALARALRGLGHRSVKVAGEGAFRYRWMPGSDAMVPDASVAAHWHAVVVMDGDRNRLGAGVGRAFAAASLRVLFDHHGSTARDGYEIVALDPSSPSTCDMVLQMLDTWGVALDRPLAELLYTGIVFDTGGFRHSNTLPASHLVAARLLEQGIDHAAIAVRTLALRRPAGVRLLSRALAEIEWIADGRVAMTFIPLAMLTETGADKGDLEGIVDALVDVEGVAVGCLVTERPDRTLKLSLRSRSDLDVARFARSLSPYGGGHPRAAGASVKMTAEAWLPTLRAELKKLVAAVPVYQREK